MIRAGPFPVTGRVACESRLPPRGPGDETPATYPFGGD